VSVRVLFVVESGTDVRLVEALAERVDVTALARAIPGGRAISQPLRHVVSVEEASPSRARFAATVLRRLIARRGDYDVVLVQGYGVAALAANLAARTTGAPTSMLVCSPIERYYACRRTHATPGKPYSRLALAALRQLARWNAVLAQRYVVLSEHLADVVRAHGADCPVHVIPVYGVDVDRFAPAAEPKNVLRHRLGLPQHAPLVFFSSRVAPEKDAETLLTALASLREAEPEFRLLHMSGGHEVLLDAARRHGVADHVIATDAVDPRDDLALDYQASDLCVQGSRRWRAGSW
jgi:glycosyltransferase involved in cell wall biosynthesis